MSEGRPFDALGRILSEGGDIALANAISRGNTRTELILLAKWRGWGASDSDIGTVRGLADRAVAAGREMTAQDPASPINLSSIPINPMLFGDDQEGLRYYASTDLKLSSTDLWYRIDFQLPDISTPSDIISQMQAHAEFMATDSPQKFNTKDGSDVTMLDYAIQTVIGRF